MASRETAANPSDTDDNPGQTRGSGTSEDDMRNGMSALHNLLCKLGGAVDEASLMSLMVGGGAKQRYKSIVSKLQNPEDETHMQAALTELCEMLSMSNEDQLAGFPVETVVPVLVACLSEQYEHNPEIMLQAARALTWLADVLPTSCAIIVRHGAVSAFCARLLAIQYIDVAEQSLQALEKVSVHMPEACLRQGGLMAVLSFLDFFPSSVQRSAVATAASMAAKLSLDTMHFALEVMPNLLNLIMYENANVVNSAALALSRIATAAARDPDSLQRVAAAGLVDKGLSLLDVTPTGAIEGHLPPTSFFLIIGALKTCAAASPDISSALLLGSLHTPLHRLLAHSGTALASADASSAVKSQQQLVLVLQLLAALMPAVPDPGVLVTNGPEAAVQQLEAADGCGAAERARFLHDNGAITSALAQLYLPLLQRIHSAHSSRDVCKLSLTCIVSLLARCSPEQLSVALLDVPVSSFVVSLLNDPDGDAAAYGVAIAELLLNKLPDTYTTQFVKEGTCHALSQLATALPAEQPTLQVRTRAMARTSSTPEQPQPQEVTLLERAARRARVLISQHFGDGSKLDTAGLRQLRTLMRKLEEPAEGAAALHDLLMLLANANHVSAFELVTSGIISTLTRFISAADVDGGAPEAARAERLAAAAAGLFPTESRAGAEPLVRKLVSTLEAAADFRVSMTPMPAFSGVSSLGRRHPALAQLTPHQQRLYALTQPLKLRLRRVESTSIRDYSASTVLVEPLAKLASVEEFLFSRTRLGFSEHAAEDAGETAAGAGRRADEPPPPPPAEAVLPPRRITRSQAGAAAAAPRPRGAEPSRGSGHAAANEALRAVAAAAAPRRHSPDSDTYDMSEDGSDGVVVDDDEDDDDDDDDVVDGEDVPDMYEQADLALEDEELDGEMADGDKDGEQAGGGDEPGPPMVQNVQLQDAEAAAAAAAASPGGAWGAGAGAAAAAPERKIVLMVGDRVLPSQMTVLQATLSAHEAGNSCPEDGCSDVDAQSIWQRVHTLQYALAKDVPAAALAAANDPEPGTSAVASLPAAAAAGARHAIARVQAAADTADISGLSSPATLECLALLRTLAALQAVAPQLSASAHAALRLPRAAFHSTAVNSKLLHQLKDTVALCAGALPQWCLRLPRHCKFLFPFETRRRFLFYTAFSVGRTLNYIQQVASADAVSTDPAAGAGSGLELRVARLSRQKVRVSRHRVLESAMKVFSMYSSSKNVLEFEFFNEVGTGLGPTLEFYTLLAAELQRASLAMWREQRTAEFPAGSDADQPGVEAMSVDGAAIGLEGEGALEVTSLAASGPPVKANAGGAALVYTSSGLFPRPYAPGTCPKKVLGLFDMLGKVVAKCLQDGRLIDLQLAPALLRALQGQPLALADLHEIDPGLGASISKMTAAVANRHADGSVHVDGCAVEELCLCFTLPGYPEFELRPGGADVAVNSANVEQYLQLLVSATLESGVRAQINAFTAAFNTIFDSNMLQCMYEDELEVLLRGQGEQWTRTALLDAIRCDHGYTKASQPVQDLVDVLCALDISEQRSFLKFVTGSPRLPPGGMASLRPRLTVVCKRSATSDGSTANPGQPDESCDSELPSVMTCANYMKLPPFSSKEVCRRQLTYAFTEGQGSFHLS